MAKEELKKYIQANLYVIPLFKIKQLLFQRGYAQEDIEDAASEVLRGMQPRKTLNTKHFLIKGIIGLFILAIISVLLFLFLTKDTKPMQLLDLRIIEIPENVYSGSDLIFNVEALNLGKQERYDITLRYDILDSQGNYFPGLRSEQTLALEGKSRFPGTIKINLKQGNYKLRVKAFYSGQVATASENFQVLKPETTPAISSEPQPEASAEINLNITAEDCGNCDDKDACTRDFCESGICQHEPMENCCGNNICEESETTNNCPEDCVQKVSGYSDTELEDKALASASVSSSEAIRYCLSISSQYNADFCLNECAEKSKKQEFCQRIRDLDKRDNCYMTLALDKKPELCKFIINGYKKNSCLALA